MSKMPAKRIVALLPILAAASLSIGGHARAEQTVWRIDNLERIGGLPVQVVGKPTVVQGPRGKALRFDGDDSVLVDGRPLVGATAFTIEAVIRPEDGPFEQRMIHFSQTDPATGQDTLLRPTGGDGASRFMFEVRVKGGAWVLDSFMLTKSGSKFLIDFEKSHPVGAWYAVAQTYDGKIYRSYVNGVLQVESETPFTPMGPGRVRIGSRMNHVDYFHGAVAEIRFTDRALAPAEFLKAGR